MLAEAAASGFDDVSRRGPSSRPVKRRKVVADAEELGLERQEQGIAGRERGVKDEDWGSEGEAPVAENAGRVQQVIYDDFAFGSSEEDDGDGDEDVDFEDVRIGPETGSGANELEQQEELHISLMGSGPSKRSSQQQQQQRRKPASKAEKAMRLDVHKWHLLCLLLHLQARNQWCESEEVQALLKPLVSRKVISLLHEPETKPQYQRVHSFNKGIEEVCATWNREWKITAQGMRRAYWREDADAVEQVDQVEDAVDFEDFKKAATTKSGSRDLGAQLFCALLRSLAVETRLLSSLQVLPFSGAAKGQTTPRKPPPQYIYASNLYGNLTSSAATNGGAANAENPRWRLAEHASTSSSSPRHRPGAETPPPRKKRVRDSPYPIYWVEALNPATASWIPLDPVVRKTINKPKTGFEPPLTDSLNAMSYVVAFEEDGSAKDVTRRYTQHYNAKTRKTRVESTKGGDAWMARTIRWFERLKMGVEPRDEIEDAELARREAGEGMPKNVVDFKGHPWYVLERHLRRNEVVWPRREAGKVTVGLARDGKLESVFKRRDVHLVRSAEQWYRKGRDVRAGETPLKRVVGRAKRDVPPDRKGEEDDDDDDEDQESEGKMLYAEFQTDVYIPPPVVRGKIPKNAYGNLDVYVPSMIPAGAIHLQHSEAARAAKVLGVDFADAVTGFDFKGRKGTAVINGVVVAAGYRDALVEVVEALEHERVSLIEERRSVAALAMWKRFMTALKIRAKIEEDYGNGGKEPAREGHGEEDGDATYHEDNEGNEGIDDDDDGGGGFMLEAREGSQTAGNEEPPEPPTPGPFPLDDTLNEITYQQIVITESPHQVPDPDPLEASSLRLKSHAKRREEHNVTVVGDGGGGTDRIIAADDGGDDDGHQDEGEGGGFLVDDDGAEAEAGGGFVIEDDDDEDAEEEINRRSSGPGSRLPETSRDAAYVDTDHVSTPPQQHHHHRYTATADPRHSGNEEAAETRDNPADSVGDEVQEDTARRGDGDADPTGAGVDMHGDGMGGQDHDGGEEPWSSSLPSHDPEEDDAEPDWAVDL